MVKLYHKLADHAQRTRKPMDMIIELTYRCNYRCDFCFVDHSATEELCFENWRAILCDLRAAGCITLLFTGGDPFQHKDCMPLLREARAMGFLVNLYTNASSMTPQQLEELARLNLLHIGISLYGMDATTHDAYTGNPGSFNRAIRNIRWLKDHGCNLVLKWNALPGRVHQTQAFIELADRLEVGSQISGVTKACRDGRCQQRVSDRELFEMYCTVFASPSKREQLLTEARRVAGGLQSANDLERSVCNMGQAGARIDPQGFLYPCMDMGEPIGNLVQTPFLELWRSQELATCSQRFKRKDFPSCSTCALVNVCDNVCPGGFKHETGSYFTPCHEFCRNTVIKIKAMAECLEVAVGHEENVLKDFLETDYGFPNTAPC